MPEIEAWAWQVGVLNFQLIRQITIDLGFRGSNQSREMPGVFANHVFGLQAQYGTHATVLLRVRTDVGFAPEGFVELAFCTTDVMDLWQRHARPEIQRIGFAALRRVGGPFGGKEALDFGRGVDAIFHMISELRLTFGFCPSTDCCRVLPFLPFLESGLAFEGLL